MTIGTYPHQVWLAIDQAPRDGTLRRTVATEMRSFAERILPLDPAAARRVASLNVPDKAPQHDALIAGTALARGMTVVTRNARDFEGAGVEYVNPWSDI